MNEFDLSGPGSSVTSRLAIEMKKTAAFQEPKLDLADMDRLLVTMFFVLFLACLKYTGG